MKAQIKRVYDPAADSDGERYLVERLWPRGIRKESLQLNRWLRDLAPSTNLRKWFRHDPGKWAEFRRRYRRELDAHPGICQPVFDAARRGPVTLLYSAHDIEHSAAVVLEAYLEEHQPGRTTRRSK